MVKNNKGQYVKTNPADRFWDKVRKTDTCWIWTGALNAQGYGVIDIDGVNRRAHRFVLEMNGQQLPSDMMVLHKCDNPPCVNPDHLFLGSQTDNVKDMRDKSRASDYFTQKAHDHPASRLTEDDVENIKALKGKISQKEIGAMYGIAQQTVSKIHTGRRYA